MATLMDYLQRAAQEVEQQKLMAEIHRQRTLPERIQQQEMRAPTPQQSPTDLEKRVQKVWGLDPDVNRMNILPFEKTFRKGQPYNVFPTMPQMGYDAIKNATVPDHVMHGGTLTPQEEVEFGLAIPGTQLAGGLMARAAKLPGTQPGGPSSGMFLPDTDALPTRVRENKEVAIDRMTAGEDPGDIWRAQGWYFDPASRQWKFEISDNYSVLDDALLTSQKAMPISQGGKGGVKLKDVLQHPLLYKYTTEIDGKSIGDTKVVYDPNSPRNAGHFQRAGKYIVIGPHSSPEQMRSTLLHEVQHAIQRWAGWEGGNNPAYLREIISDEWLEWSKDPAVNKFMIRFNTPAVKKRFDDASEELSDLYHTQGFKRIRDDLANANFHEKKMTWDAAQKNADEVVNKKFDEVYRDQYPDYYGIREQFNALPERPDVYWGSRYMNPYEVYRRIAGEAEAWNVEERLKMSDEAKKARPPNETRRDAAGNLLADEDIFAARDLVSRRDTSKVGGEDARYLTDIFRSVSPEEAVDLMRRARSGKRNKLFELMTPDGET